MSYETRHLALDVFIPAEFSQNAQGDSAPQKEGAAPKASSTKGALAKNAQNREARALVRSLRNHRMSAEVEIGGQMSSVQTRITLTNPPLDVMKRLAHYGKSGLQWPVGGKSLVQNRTQPAAPTPPAPDTSTSAAPHCRLYAWSGPAEAPPQDGTALVTQAVIANASARLSSAPDPTLQIELNPQFALSAAPSPVLSAKGTVSLRDLAGRLARQTGMVLGYVPDVKLMNPYFTGCAREQLEALAREAGCFYLADGRTLVMYNHHDVATSVPLPGHQIWDIARATDMIGWPEWNGSMISLRVLFNPAIQWFDHIRIHDASAEDMDMSGTYLVVNIKHSLSANQGGGPWFTTLTAAIDDGEDRKPPKSRAKKPKSPHSPHKKHAPVPHSP